MATWRPPKNLCPRRGGVGHVWSCCCLKVGALSRLVKRQTKRTTIVFGTPMTLTYPSVNKCIKRIIHPLASVSCFVGGGTSASAQTTVVVRVPQRGNHELWDSQLYSSKGGKVTPLHTKNPVESSRVLMPQKTRMSGSPLVCFGFCQKRHTQI